MFSHSDWSLEASEITLVRQCGHLWSRCKLPEAICRGDPFPSERNEIFPGLYTAIGDDEITALNGCAWRLIHPKSGTCSLPAKPRWMKVQFCTAARVRHPLSSLSVSGPMRTNWRSDGRADGRTDGRTFSQVILWPRLPIKILTEGMWWDSATCTS